MTPKLRRTHRLIWWGILPLLALAFWASITAAPRSFPQAELYREQPAALPQLIRSHDTPAFGFALRRAESTEAQQLEILLKTPLPGPGTAVYQWIDRDTPQARRQFLGYLGQRGSYRFPIGTSIPAGTDITLELFDLIQREQILLVSW